MSEQTALVLFNLFGKCVDLITERFFWMMVGGILVILFFSEDKK